MSYTGVTSTPTRPTGITLIVFLNAFLTILGYIGVVGFALTGFATMGIGASGGTTMVAILLIVFTLFVGVYMVLLFGVYRLNRTAYYIFIIWTTISVILSLISINILGILVQGGTLAYMLQVRTHFD